MMTSATVPAVMTSPAAVVAMADFGSTAAMLGRIPSNVPHREIRIPAEVDSA